MFCQLAFFLKQSVPANSFVLNSSQIPQILSLNLSWWGLPSTQAGVQGVAGRSVPIEIPEDLEADPIMLAFVRYVLIFSAN